MKVLLPSSNQKVNEAIHILTAIIKCKKMEPKKIFNILITTTKKIILRAILLFSIL